MPGDGSDGMGGYGGFGGFGGGDNEGFGAGGEMGGYGGGFGVGGGDVGGFSGSGFGGGEGWGGFGVDSGLMMVAVPSTLSNLELARQQGISPTTAEAVGNSPAPGP